MIRLHLTAEGPTEKNFAIRILRPYLATFRVFVDARCVLTSKDKKASKEYRGGLVSYEKAEADVLAWMKEDSNAECRFTTMFDLYGLPKDFPGLATAKRKATDHYERVRLLEENMARSINDRRFIPYIQLHEFETLILAAPENLDCQYLEHDRQIRKLISLVEGKNPELINDGNTTAPSKRILKQIPEYDKATAGVSIVEKTGLETLRAKCRHFDEWLTCLEQLSGGTP